MHQASNLLTLSQESARCWCVAWHFVKCVRNHLKNVWHDGSIISRMDILYPNFPIPFKQQQQHQQQQFNDIWGWQMLFPLIIIYSAARCVNAKKGDTSIARAWHQMSFMSTLVWIEKNSLFYFFFTYQPKYTNTVQCTSVQRKHLISVLFRCAVVLLCIHFFFLDLI